MILETRGLGQSGPSVSRIGLGCAPFGNLFSEVSDEDVQATVDAAWDGEFVSLILLRCMATDYRRFAWGKL